ncbi:MAG: DUF6515 family protein [Steroidobacteraceae bacterium]
MNAHTSRFAAIFLGASLLLPLAGIAQDRHGHDRGPRGEGPRMNFDNRYHHDHYYPPRGYAVHALPPGYRTVFWHGDRFFMRGGVWYRPYGPRFEVFAPPIGLIVPFLPEFYTTVWFGGVPYYYANDTYYMWDRGASGYVVSRPPEDTEDRGDERPAGSAGGSEDFFVYPRDGQSEEQTSKDRFECHQWAVSQTAFDPSEPEGGVDASQNARKRADYRRAITACLEGRQYSVR